MHFAGIRNYVLFRSGNAEVATDIAQETFLKIWEKQNSIQTEKVKGLLYKIAGDLFITHHRKEKRSFNFFDHFVFLFLIGLDGAFKHHKILTIGFGNFHQRRGILRTPSFLKLSDVGAFGLKPKWLRVGNGAVHVEEDGL